MRRFRFALRPRWLALHLLTVALGVTMVLLGRWQLDVSDTKHFDLQNFGYAIQWWLFTAFAVFFWARLMREAVKRGGTVRVAPGETAVPADDRPVNYRRYVAPSAQRSTDSVHAAYNDYLKQLDEDGKR